MADVSPPENSVVYGLRIQPFLNESPKQGWRNRGCRMGLEPPRFPLGDLVPHFYNSKFAYLSNTISSLLGPLLINRLMKKSSILF